MSNAINLSGQLVYLLVTGASKGIGAKLAVETSRNLQAGSTVVLLARSMEGLKATKAEILTANIGLKVVAKAIDLTRPSKEDLMQLIEDSYDVTVAYDLAMLVHNVGTLGDSSKWARDIEDYSELESYFSTNVFAPMLLNNLLLKVVSPKTRKFVVNITSKAAIAPFKSFGFYCSGKAARQMFFRVLAEESKDVLVLNYSPGPVETAMTVDAQERSVSDETSGMFKKLRSEGTILTTEETTKRFLEVVSEGKYQSGDHVDFYDA